MGRGDGGGEWGGGWGVRTSSLSDCDAESPTTMVALIEKVKVIKGE